MAATVVIPTRTIQQGLYVFAAEEGTPSPGRIDGLWGPRTLNAWLLFNSYLPRQDRYEIEAPARARSLRVGAAAYQHLRPYIARYSQQTGETVSKQVDFSTYADSSSSPSPAPSPSPSPAPASTLDLDSIIESGSTPSPATPSSPIPEPASPSRPWSPPTSQNGKVPRAPKPDFSTTSRPASPQPTQRTQVPGMPVPPLAAQQQRSGAAWGPILLGVLGIAAIGGLVWYVNNEGRG